MTQNKLVRGLSLSCSCCHQEKRTLRLTCWSQEEGERHEEQICTSQGGLGKPGPEQSPWLTYEWATRD